MPHCPNCYQFAPICPKGDDNNEDCTGFTPDAASSRLENGRYDAIFVNTLPSEVQNTDGVHLDHLTGYAGTTATASSLSESEQAIADDLDTIALNNLGTCCVLGEKRPGLSPAIRQKISILMDTGPTQAQTAQIMGTLSQLLALEKASKESLGAGSVSSTTVFKASNYPMATLFQNIVKNVEKGLDVAPSASEMLDVTTGKKYIPFERTTKVASPENFIYSVHVFITSILSVKKEAPTVYYPFAKELKRACTAGGHVFAQHYADALLRALDDGIFKNPVTLFNSGEHNRIYAEI